MKRKVVQHGPSTLIVSLPSNWVKQNNIQKGDEIEVEEHENKIIINNGEVRNKLMEGNFDFSNYPDFLVFKMIARIYEFGYDKVTITIEDRKQVDLIEKRMPELMGFEIIESKTNSLTIMDISSANLLSMDQILKKAFLMVKAMIEETLDNLENNNFDKLRYVKEKDLKVNRFSYFCLRQINKNVAPNRDVYVLFHLSKSLEDLGDIIKLFIDNILEIKKIDKKLLELLSMNLRSFDMAIDFFYEPKLDIMEKYLKEYKKFYQEFKTISKSIDNESNLQLFNLLEMSKKIYHFPTLRMHTLEKALM